MSSTPEQVGPDPVDLPEAADATAIPKVEIPVPTGEIKVLSAIQRVLLSVPGSTAASLTLSHVGEHALGWMALAGAGMVFDRDRRGRWAMVGVGTFGAHAASVVVKRVFRRRRPDHPTVTVGVGTPSSLSFPSSHATSTTAFALLAGSVSGTPTARVLIPAMLASRLTLGVHYPTDVFAGAAVGAGCAALTRAVWPTDAVQRVLPETLRDAAAGPAAIQDLEEKR